VVPVAETDVSVELRGAMEAGQLLLHYQPKLKLAADRITDVEALLRWNHPERGLLAAGEFLDRPLSTEVAVELGHWVLRSAVQQIAEWTAAGIELGVCVNFSPRQLTDPTLLDALDSLTAQAGIPATSVNMEITEAAALSDLPLTVERVHAIRERGLDVTLDDFGTGFSSLTWLQELPVSMLKLDRSFVAQLGKHPRTDAIVEAVLHLGHALDLYTIGEGVETPEQLERLRHLECDAVQGYYISRPVPADKIPALL
jgi:EAL domain-containing protein (putative c-di-GMP-specific phosphodiesterase class I)